MAIKHVVVGMTGGVDSSVAAALLLGEGYEVTGVTLRLRARDDVSPADDLVTAAQTVADHLGFPLYVLDRVQQFRDVVLRPSWEEYARGRTPNPCAICNPAIKFDALLEVAREVGAEWVATGHYARVKRESSAALMLMRGRDCTKDQSYFLFALTPEHLAQVLFPIGDLTKAEVRRIAHDLKLPSAGSGESQDACVISLGETLPEFLRTSFDAPSVPGAIVATDGTMLGTHDGFHRFTVGQRRGVGIAVGVPAWVKEIDPATGTVMMTTDRNDLLATGLQASGMIWHDVPHHTAPFSCEVQVRYSHQPVQAVVTPSPGSTATIRFAVPVRAVTPGQAVVLYGNDTVRGGGWIERAVHDRAAVPLDSSSSGAHPAKTPAEVALDT